MTNDADNKEEKPWTYDEDLNEFREVMPLLKNAIVQRVLTDISTDFNCLFLLTDKGIYLFQCRLQGEIVGIFKEDDIVEDRYREFELFEQFVGKRIENIRMTGSPWNGHGYEISFEGLYGRTMLIQSIYSDRDKSPYRFDACMRLGIGHYYWQNVSYLTGQTTLKMDDDAFHKELDFIALNNLSMLLKRARAESKMSLQEVASRMKTTPDVVEGIENHPAQVSLAQLEQYVSAIRKYMNFYIPGKLPRNKFGDLTDPDTPTERGL